MKIDHPHKFTPEGRLKVLLDRIAEKKNGSVNADMQCVANAYYKFQSVLMQLRLAEMEMEHAVRGLEHEDYNSLFEGWARA